MKRHPTLIIHTANRGGCCVDEELNNIDCHIFVATYVMERHVPIFISSTGSDREVFDQTLNYSFVDSFIIARSMEEFIAAKTKR
mmetsp:Transcript_16726/g.28446  ORF Transcript_16726/g.28446 Transcript_16726/m.28446 type:complete len:84 (+) Transcript_16726:731-982(+)